MPAKVAKLKQVESCGGCPFATGKGGGDVMPGFVRCSISDDQLIDGSPTEGYGKPPPAWCPLRSMPLAIEVRLKR
jgi:hypothetical protein